MTSERSGSSEEEGFETGSEAVGGSDSQRSKGRGKGRARGGGRGRGRGRGRGKAAPTQRGARNESFDADGEDGNAKGIPSSASADPPKIRSASGATGKNGEKRKGNAKGPVSSHRDSVSSAGKSKTKVAVPPGPGSRRKGGKAKSPEVNDAAASMSSDTDDGGSDVDIDLIEDSISPGLGADPGDDAEASDNSGSTTDQDDDDEGATKSFASAAASIPRSNGIGNSGDAMGSGSQGSKDKASVGKSKGKLSAKPASTDGVLQTASRPQSYWRIAGRLPSAEDAATSAVSTTRIEAIRALVKQAFSGGRIAGIVSATKSSASDRALLKRPLRYDVIPRRVHRVDLQMVGNNFEQRVRKCSRVGATYQVEPRIGQMDELAASYSG